MPEPTSEDTTSMGDFVVQNEDTKYIAARLIRMLVLATNKHKLDYGTLRYIYRQTTKRAKLSKSRPAKKLYQLPTNDEIELFFANISDQQLKMLFTVIHNCGLRVAEVCKLKVADIDFTNQTIFINGKGNKDRLVPITNRMVEKIQLYLHGKRLRYLFETRLGTPFTTRRVEQICSEVKSKAQIQKKLTPHTFRHFYFSKLAEQGVDVDIRALIAGHSSSKTQEVYSHLGLSGTKSLILETLQKMENEKILK